MGVAKQKDIQILFLGGVARPQEGGLHAEGVSVAQQDPPIFQAQQLLGEVIGAEIAVSGDLLKGNVGEIGLQPLGQVMC